MIFRGKIKFPINSWTDCLQGETAFIIGNGPSLLENNLNLLDDFFSIGINRVFKVKIPTILIWQDSSLYDDSYESLTKIPCAKLTINSIDNENLFTHYCIIPDYYRFHKTPAKLYGGGCTAALAAQLSFAMGCSSIVLLGCDFSYKNGKTDFYGTNKYHTENTLNNFLNTMNWLKSECPIPIFNCGDAISWPRISLEEAIRKTNPKKENHIVRLNKLLGKN